MKEWQKFEIMCCDYLNATYGNDMVAFVVQGGSNSASSDIAFLFNGINVFNIEVKSPKAQSGQFVVLNNNGEFIFSPRNKSDEIDAELFLAYMTANYHKYAVATTTGADINMETSQYNDWIIDHYRKKNSAFVMTRGSKSFIVFPIEKYGKYFDTICKYRVKKSGSTDVPKKHVDEVIKHFDAYEHKWKSGKKLYIKTKLDYSINESHTINGYDYSIRDRDSDGYLYIRRLSNTANPNVIFSVQLKREQDPNDLKIFIDSLRGK